MPQDARQLEPERLTMYRAINIIFALAAVSLMLCACGGHREEESVIKSDMVDKLPMQADGIVRLSKIKVNPEYIGEYLKYAVEVGEISLLTEPGVLTMYAVADKNDSCSIMILETYASQEAYRSHIASEHFQKYKQGTLHMVDSLALDDVTPLNPANKIVNFIKE
ncbi:MAG: antibiotic biosynthesis monooxygenase [Duncaniella sp.]|nr:antibiotic biosynthesis monooxygenase [Duncaniella sp.]